MDEDLPKSELEVEPIIELEPMPELEPMEVAIMAYQLWELRGCPYGSPDDDWYEAERRIKAWPERDANGVGPREN